MFSKFVKYNVDVIGLGGSHATTTLTGVVVGIDVTRAEKIWNILTALGNIAFAYAFSMVLIEVQVKLFNSFVLLLLLFIRDKDLCVIGVCI